MTKHMEKRLENISDDFERENLDFLDDLEELMARDQINIEEIEELLDAHLEIVDQIIDNETWYEGEKRGRPVDSDDPQVYERVCHILDKDAYSIVEAASRLVKEKRSREMDGPSRDAERQ